MCTLSLRTSTEAKWSDCPVLLNPLAQKEECISDGLGLKAGRKLFNYSTLLGCADAWKSTRCAFFGRISPAASPALRAYELTRDSAILIKIRKYFENKIVLKIDPTSKSVSRSEPANGPEKIKGNVRGCRPRPRQPAQRSPKTHAVALLQVGNTISLINLLTDG